MSASCTVRLHTESTDRLYLEGQVLEEVGGAICLCRLGSRTGIDPHADGGSLGIWRVLGGDGEAILESGGLGLDGSGDGGRKGSLQGGRRVRPLCEALGQVQSKSPRGHGEGAGRVCQSPGTGS